MTTQEAIKTRHTVRRYRDRSISGEIRELLLKRMEQHNRERNLALCLVTENGEAFGPLLKLFLAKGVRNYVILAGPNRPGLDEDLGYYGADVMLLAQTLGLNSWWVGETFHRKGLQKNAPPEAETILGLIALGYGVTQGVPHKSKRPEEVAFYQGESPEWFTKGVEAVLLAPTALNKQAFTIRGQGRRVSMTCDNGVFSGVDLGIGKYHFEVGAGRDHFDWA